MLQVTRNTIVILGLSVLFGQTPAGNSMDAGAEQRAWRAELEQRNFVFPPNYSGLLTSLKQFSADCEIHVVFNPKKKWWLQFRFMRDGHEIIDLRGHDQSAFVSFQNTLYFAKYSPDSMGCIVMAYDLTSGKEIWKTELHHAKPAGHSGYSNLVTMRISNPQEIKGEVEGASIIITGRESYCDYVEVLDRKTGASLAVKNYRVGFGPPPNAAGGFDGRSVKRAQKWPLRLSE